MSKNEMISKVEYLRELEEMMEEIKAEADTIRDGLKAEMMERGLEEMTCGQYIIRWTAVISNRFDSTAFKKQFADLYKNFTKPVSSRRFSVSC